MLLRIAEGAQTWICTLQVLTTLVKRDESWRNL